MTAADRDRVLKIVDEVMESWLWAFAFRDNGDRVLDILRARIAAIPVEPSEADKAMAAEILRTPTPGQMVKHGGVSK